MLGREIGPYYKADEPPAGGREEESGEPTPEKIVASLRKIILGAIMEATPEQLELLQLEMDASYDEKIKETMSLVGRIELLLDTYQTGLTSEEIDILSIMAEIAPALWIVGVTFEEIEEKLRADGILE